LRSESECQLLLGIPFLGIRSIAHRFVTLIERQKDIQEPVESHTNSSVSAPIPYYISETKSDMRGIKPGWYAIEDDGTLYSGPFSSFEECVKRIAEPTNGTLAS
jgi:hypothetical protein